MKGNWNGADGSDGFYVPSPLAGEKKSVRGIKVNFLPWPLSLSQDSSFLTFFNSSSHLFDRKTVPPAILLPLKSSLPLRKPSPIGCLVPLFPSAMASDKEAANALKLQGNKAVVAHDWPTALDFYTQAIEKYDKEPAIFCNRAQVRPNLSPLRSESHSQVRSTTANTALLLFLGRLKSNLKLLDSPLPMLPELWNWTRTTSRLVAVTKIALSFMGRNPT